MAPTNGGDNFVDMPLASIIMDQQVFEKTLKEFKSVRDAYFESFAAVGLQPSTAEQDGSDEDNLNKKRENYKWGLRPDFVPQVDQKVLTDKKILIPPHDILEGKRLEWMSKIISDPSGHDPLAPGPGVQFMKDIEDLNQTLHKDGNKGDFYDAPNVGLREDWFTDAQQQFTGVNPTSITILSDDLILNHFAAAAEAQRNVGKIAKNIYALIYTYNASAAASTYKQTGNFPTNTEVVQLITSLSKAKQLYIQDCSYYRKAAGLQPDEDFRSEANPPTNTSLQAITYRYGCASIVLFSLELTGKLHPLAITLDYKQTEASRVTIFNKRLAPTDATHDEKTDWPWRYAKMCAQVSDWSRHEMAVHLTDTHLIEETIIVAAQRNLPDSHIILQILNSHWKTTLSLNALAYGLLVPKMITPVSPFTHAQVVKFIGQIYARAEFDFKGRYVPTDLERRGFPVVELENPTGKFHNYTYARQVYKMWSVIRKFVASILTKSYADDAAVAADRYLSGFITEIRTGDGKTQEGGFLPKFPVVTTLEGLIDMVTMCIHIAAPQHSAVNYLQQYYLSFVPNRPGSLFTPLPTSLAELQSITEKDVLTALPLSHPNKWLTMAGVPYLLSEDVKAVDNIISYSNEVAGHRTKIIAEAGKAFRQDIIELVNAFKESSSQNDDQYEETEYRVLYPDSMASAIII